MPTYEYKCEACGYEFEKFQSITAAPIKKCPQCGKSKVKRLIGTGAGLIFKGSGFYITDYRSEGYKSAEKSDSGAGGGENKSSSNGEAGKGESKPAAESKPAGAAAKPAAESKPAGSKPSSKKK